MANKMQVRGALIPDGFVLTIEHDERASYARTVTPRAMREAPLFALFNSTRTDVFLCATDHGSLGGGRAWSSFTFRNGAARN